MRALGGSNFDQLKRPRKGDRQKIRIAARLKAGDAAYMLSSDAPISCGPVADDFIVTARTKETLEQMVKPVVVAFLAERGLELSE